MIPSQEEWNNALKQRHGEVLFQKFSTASVAVCGLGGLGSHIAVALARAGVGRLILIDFDRVDVSNLHRQQYKASQTGRYKTEALTENLKEIAPYLQVHAVTERICEENLVSLLSGADVVCEAFDDAEAKAMLVNGVMGYMPGVYLVAASGMAGMGTPNTIHTRKITGRFYLCGDETSEVSENISLVAPRVMLCAAHQAHTTLRILAGEYEV
ncbi:MAG: thiamine biosynthesis protein ThiF [Peptococcaceae bacterium]|nr:thiamine biosynthesis protein ThiF [Peptococcaceae bacterium]